MTPRVEGEITLQIKRNIRRINQKISIVVLDDVPITPRSIRRFMLMQEDYIQLEFSLPTAEYIAIGDFVDEPLFGMRFYLTEEVMPKYNTNTGGYDYSLKFEAPYMVWKNWMHCLIADGQRMESQWHLTDRLTVHAQQIADEVNLLTGKNYRVEVTCTNANEVHFLTYGGVSIIEAMNMIADAWECEWWVTNDGATIDGVDYTGVIHFGKCEQSGDRYDFILGDNVESMDIARDQQTYATRIYAYGGKQNIPENYDRKLVLTATDAAVNTILGTTTFVDSARKLTSAMLKGEATYGKTEFKLSQQGTISASGAVLSATKTMYADDYTLAAGSAVVLRWDWNQQSRPGTTGDKTVKVKVYFNDIEVAYNTDSAQVLTEMQNTSVDTNGYSTWSYTLDPDVWIDLRGKLKLNASASVTLRLEFSFTGFLTNQYASTSFELGTNSVQLTATGSEKTSSKETEVVYNGSTYNATFNPLHHYGDEDASKIRIAGALSGFSEGSKVTIPESGLNLLEIPYSFYTLDYSLGTLGLVGERRLHLPLASYPNRFTPADEPFDMTQTVEMVVAFEKIFPKMELIISEVATETKIEDIKHDDGSVERLNWVQYKFKVTDKDGEPFTFNTRYIMDGNRLEAAFTAAANMVPDGFMLGSMTFEVGFDNDTQEYTIIRNENYGTKLPNGYIYPKVGDTLFLTGWNPKAISSLNLVSRAEQELAEKAEELLSAIKAGQFTFTCNMMSDWPFDLLAQPFMAISQANEREHYTTDGKPFYVSNGYTEYALLREGCPVRVHHDALPEVDGGHYKDSRIIGYEFKLDKPYDTPRYTIGETDAYSRLKKIEKGLTKL